MQVTVPVVLLQLLKATVLVKSWDQYFPHIKGVKTVVWHKSAVLNNVFNDKVAWRI